MTGIEARLVSPSNYFAPSALTKEKGTFSWGDAPGYCIVRRWRTDARFFVSLGWLRDPDLAR
jgi:hypothetical protein